jgi:translation initiation factor 5
MALNVNRNVADAFYRYKMPRLLAKVEGKGNGIKTVIVNMTEVAKALGRPPTCNLHFRKFFFYPTVLLTQNIQSRSDPTKFFGCELGAQTQFDIKNDRFIVNGAHEAGKLQQMLDIFIKKFVLCPGCDNPETVLTVLTISASVKNLFPTIILM